MTLPELMKDYMDKRQAAEQAVEQYEEDRRVRDVEKMDKSWDVKIAAREAKDKAYEKLVAAEKLLHQHAFEAVELLKDGIERLDAVVREYMPNHVDSPQTKQARELLAKVGHLIP